jgi:hypothetical protein
MDKGLRIIPTYQCNENCYMCYQKSKSGAVLLPNQLEKILNEQLHEEHFKYITYMGGELSLFPENTKQYIKIGKQAFPLAKSSLTTNGHGAFSFYKECIQCGLDAITFSIHKKNEELEEKILALKMERIPVRVNCYLDFNKIQNAQQTFRFCDNNDISLTFCTDLREKEKFNLMKLGDLIDIGKPHYYKIKESHAICKVMEGITFWIFWSSDYEDAPNTIILPSGEITTSFKDVINGK